MREFLGEIQGPSPGLSYSSLFVGMFAPLLYCSAQAWKHPLGYEDCTTVDPLVILPGYVESFLELSVMSERIMIYFSSSIDLRRVKVGVIFSLSNMVMVVLLVF